MSSAADPEIVTRNDEGRDYHPDLALDPSDPLNLLLNNSNDTESELSQAASPPDWSQLNSLWSMQSTDAANDLQSTVEKANLGSGFDFSFPMDLDFNDPSLSMVIDPNSLFIDGKGLQLPFHDSSAVPIQPQDLLSAPFPFTFSSPTLSSASASSQSADESSSALSSSPGSPSALPTSPAAPKTTADAIAAFFSQANRPSVQGLMTSIPALPSAKTPPVQVEPQSWHSSASSSPSPGPPTHAPGVTQTQMTSGTAVIGRPKTSHTTIERRYRTNLNARIQSLKAAVPALRVLDQNYKSDEYKVDDRGYIDGVKVARKGSKANVLGKAVEYIRVLKRREARLKREQDGLRTLLCGFPGGQNLLTEWDIEWTKKFGGPERDEIDNLGAEEASDDEDGDGDGEEDGDISSERARKKPKVDAAPQKKERRKIAPAPAAAILPAPGSTAPVAAPGAVPEKRKRGRPRKIQPNVAPPITASAPVLLTDPSLLAQQGIVIPPATSQTAQPQQYLLAVFALFSFFNSPLTSSPVPVPHQHTHEGSVLSHITSSSASSFSRSASGWSWNDFVQIVHLLASVAVFISIIVPWVPVPRKLSQSRILQLMPFSSLVFGSRATVASMHELTDLPTPPASPDVSDSDSEAESSSTEDTVRAGGHVRGAMDGLNPLASALGSRGSAEEFENLVNILNINSGVISILRSAVSTRKSSQGSDTRRERQAWMRLAELLVLFPENASVPLRWQVYNYFSSFSGSPGSEVASTSLASDFCTLALLAQTLPLPFAEARSQALWSRAKALVELDAAPTFEHLVFDNMTVEEAVESLALSKPSADSSPIAALASTLLRKRLHAYASALFIERVTQSQDSDSDFPSAEDRKSWRDTITFGRSLGGSMGLLSDAFAKVWHKSGDLFDIDALESAPADEDIRALLSAILLYQRVFTPREVLCHAGVPGGEAPVAFILSPPPTPPSKTGGNHEQSADVILKLRRALGSNVFEESGETRVDEFSLEDARDRVVDMLVDLERGRRSRVV
ncbi:hypothetical protein HYDPIDRAFT_115907 [Hydnomerulius pinastri MD-312]|uniref:BHLH domain-containing protein n=1 Tax=Hydnomerulius pinastri MD-312 TaxID=994086 RepID=A0A0C9WC77_9AGAM|nr:hypothetical protein HYDPIDRAFT_115907 [Hydnomerulius pinastri MD-312]